MMYGHCSAIDAKQWTSGNVQILCICPEVYDGLEECKEICWMCSDCNGKVLENKGGEDKVLPMLEKLMDKICGLEQRLQQKVDVKKLEELESNMNK